MNLEADIPQVLREAIEENARTNHVVLAGKRTQTLKRGRLQFMDGQLFGRLAQLAYKSLSAMWPPEGGRLSDRTRARLRFIRDHIQSGKPKLASCRLRETLHIYIDACHEKGHEHPAGFGGVLIDESGNQVSYFSELVEADSLRVINAGESQNPIFELECLALLMAVELGARGFPSATQLSSPITTVLWAR